MAVPDSLPHLGSGAADDSGRRFLSLRLYVANRSPNSVRAMANLDHICRECLDAGSYRLEIIDVLDDPLRAVRDKILVTPTLAWTSSPPSPPLGSPSPSFPQKRESAPPRIRGLILGDLSERQRVLDALGLAGGQP
jgi:hypothetical protein